jgi:phasin family protein
VGSGKPYTSVHVALQQFLGSKFFLPSSKDIIMITAEQVIATHKANVETFLGLSQSAFAGMERFVELNVQASRAALTEVADNTRAALAARDVQEFFALQSSLVQPAAEKAVAYGRHVYDIALETNSAVARTAEAQATEAQRRFTALVDSASKNAPAGSENVVAFYKSAFATANNALESIQKAAKQSAATAEANMTALTEQAVKATKATVSKKR